MSRHVQARQWLRYQFDTTLAKGLWAVIGWLAVLTGLFFVAIAGVISLTGVGPQDQRTSFAEGLWFAMTRSLDPGTFSGDEGTRFRLLMLVVTIAGIFLAATIIGLVSSAIDTKVAALRRGRSLVIERGHTLVLGDSDKVPAVVSELVAANASRRGRAIVVLTGADPIDATEQIRAAVPDLGTSRLVTRSGVSMRITDVRQVNPESAASAIVLRSEQGSDAQVVKSVLARTRCARENPGLTIVAEVDDALTAAALTDAVGAGMVTVTSRDVIARLTAQVSRTPGLGAIYQELLDFAGDEFYSIPVTGEWLGRNVGEALLASSAGTIVGVHTAAGTVVLTPEPDRILREGDRLIGIAEDDSVFRLDRQPVDWRSQPSPHTAPLTPAKERTLIIGWSDLAPLIGREIDTHVAPGSQLHLLVADDIGSDEDLRRLMALDGQDVVVHRGDPISSADVASVLATGEFDHVMLLSERGRYDSTEADARTLLCLLHVRRCLGPDHTSNIVAEILDPNDVELGGPAAGSDFIVSQKLIALLMAQLSESPELAPVFADLFDAGGCVVEVHPVERYLTVGPHTFADVIRSCREWAVTPIGYRARVALSDPLMIGNGIRLNPPKEQPILFDGGDAIVVLSRS